VSQHKALVELREQKDDPEIVRSTDGIDGGPLMILFKKEGSNKTSVNYKTRDQTNGQSTMR